MSQIKETENQKWAICAKCEKPIEGAEPLKTENWTQLHPNCISFEELIALVTKPKRKKK